MTANIHTNYKVLWVWDHSEEPENCDEALVYRWGSYIQDNQSNSIPHYVELNGDRLRAKYLAFVHDLGETKVGNKTLIEHLAFEDKLSYWWMTLFVEKSVYKSPITEIIRAIALEEIIMEHNPSKVKLVSNNKILHRTLCELCGSLSIKYVWERFSEKNKISINLRNVLLLIPPLILSILSLSRYVFFRWPFVGKRPAVFQIRKSSIFFCSPFSNIHSSSFIDKKFKSNLWGGLPHLLERMNIHINWLHFLVSPHSIPKPASAISNVEIFNQTGKGKEFHSFLETHISYGVIAKVLQRWIKLCFIGFRLRGVKVNFRPEKSNLSLWPLLENDWKSSMYGEVAINNLLWIELFDQFMSKGVIHKVGFYLAENQSWERAFVHAWRKHGHGVLFAVSHSTVRFWDLRHYSDERTYHQPGAYKMPSADFVCLNGTVAVNEYSIGGFPDNLIVETEALRYEHLNVDRTKDIAQKEKEGILQVLILGDYLESATLALLQLLDKASAYIHRPVTFTLKSHPNFIVDKDYFPSLRLEFIMDPLGEILHKYDISYSSNKTSASVDAYLRGLPTIVMLDDMGMNFSPLRGQKNVHFVSEAEELASRIDSIGRNIVSKPLGNNFFFLDANLPRWQGLISSSLNGSLKKNQKIGMVI